MCLFQGTSSLTAKGAYGNVTEERFLLILLLSSFVTVWEGLAFNICAPPRRGGGGVRLGEPAGVIAATATGDLQHGCHTTVGGLSEG